MDSVNEFEENFSDEEDATIMIIIIIIMNNINPAAN
jgi:hypothetical protein